MFARGATRLPARGFHREGSVWLHRFVRSRIRTAPVHRSTRTLRARPSSFLIPARTFQERLPRPASRKTDRNQSAQRLLGFHRKPDTADRAATLTREM